MDISYPPCICIRITKLPRLYKPGKKGLYILVVIIALIAITYIRVHIEYFCYNLFLEKGKKMPVTVHSYFYESFSHIILLIISVVFRLSLDYYRVSRQQEQLKKRTAEAELNLLKSQVQPHFLFNTLNNIYFVAQRESPATAGLLERLSNIMRYFVDEGPKDAIPLSTELNFIQDYIELEKLRMRHPLQVVWNVNTGKKWQTDRRGIKQDLSKYR